MSRAATAGSRRMSSYRMPLPNPQLPCKGGDWSLDICAVFLEQKLPSLANEGWLRPLRKSGEASLAGADGVVRSSHQLLEVERTTPFLMFRPTGLTLRAAPPKERDHLLDGASTPPLPRRGVLTTCCLRQLVGGETRNSRCKFKSIEKSSA